MYDLSIWWVGWLKTALLHVCLVPSLYPNWIGVCLSVPTHNSGYWGWCLSIWIDLAHESIRDSIKTSEPRNTESDHRIIYGWNDKRHNLMRSDSLARASHPDICSRDLPFLASGFDTPRSRATQDFLFFFCSGQVIYIGIPTSIGQTWL